MPTRKPHSKYHPTGQRYVLPACVIALGFGACSSGKQNSRYAQAQDAAPAQHIDVSSVKDAIPRVEPYSRYGNPPSYVVLGKRYHTLDSSDNYRERGIASWYGTKFHGHRTSSGESYDMYKMSAAHKSLPLPTYARVTNLGNGKSVVVKINDRGPFHENRLIDLSYAAASRLDILGKGTGLVEIEAIDPQKYSPPARNLAVAASQPKVANPSSSGDKQTNPSLYLQLGAFLSRSNAERLQARLSKTVPGQLQITEAISNQQPVYRVRVGPLASVETADQLTKILATHGIESPRVVID
ncbi:septal ring lytic transglycosylase RlpA family protein [Pseudomonadota bacterium]